MVVSLHKVSRLHLTHNYEVVYVVRPYTCFLSECATQDRQVCTYNVTQWPFREMFTPPQLS